MESERVQLVPPIVIATSPSENARKERALKEKEPESEEMLFRKKFPHVQLSKSVGRQKRLKNRNSYYM